MSLRSAIPIGGEVVAGKTKTKGPTIPRHSKITEITTPEKATLGFVIFFIILSFIITHHPIEIITREKAILDFLLIHEEFLCV